MIRNFRASVEKLEPYGLTQLVLEGPGQSVKILPEMGSNLYSYVVDGQEMLIVPENIMAKGVLYGFPILFPTPNRVKNCTFTYAGRQYQQFKNGEPRFIHGLVYDEAWNYEEPVAGEKEAKAVTYLEVREGHPIYESFPFAFLLKMIYTLKEDGLYIEYQVENLDDKVLPFGFALHPYFGIIDSIDNIYIQVPAPYVMEAFNCMPTGEIKEVQGTKYDLNTPRPLQDLHLDDVYWKLDSTKAATIEYRGLGRKLTLQATDDFSHMVVYTPPHRKLFCLENQTCSTDAHNLFAQGKEEVSGLISLQPGEVHKGMVKVRHEYL